MRARDAFLRTGSSAALRPLRRLVGSALGGRPRRVRVLSGRARGARLELDLAREKAYWAGIYEPEVQALLAGVLAPGAVFYDVGGHIGFFSVLAARLGASVVAFEPLPENADRIRRNAALNGFAVEVIEAAAWDSDTGVSLVAGDSSSEWRAAPAGSSPSVSLDGFAAARRPPDVIKIDVEGAEVRVLAGAARILAERRPVVICEVHGREQRERVRQLLEGYDVETLGSEWRLVARRPPAPPHVGPES